MDKIILVGDIKNQVEKILLKQLNNVLVVGNNDIYLYGNQIEIIIIHVDSIGNLDIKNSLIIFCSDNVITKDSRISNRNIAITLSSYNNTINYLIKKDIPIIKVGMSNNDVITYSSKDRNKLMICIQRDINLINNIIEPKEISVVLRSDFDDSKLLLGISALIFMNKISNEIVI